jgi:hypothetical protein
MDWAELNFFNFCELGPVSLFFLLGLIYNWTDTVFPSLSFFFYFWPWAGSLDVGLDLISLILLVGRVYSLFPFIKSRYLG